MSAIFVGIFAALGAIAGHAMRPTLERYDSSVPMMVPVPEALTALLFGLAAAQYDDWRLFAILILAVSSVALSIIDLRQYRLPNPIVFWSLASAAVVIVIGEIVDGEASAISAAVVGAAVYCGILFVMHLINPAGMGFGDVKLALVLGLFVGWVAGTRLDAVRGVMIALLIGSALGVVLGLGRVVVIRLGLSFLPDPEEGSAGDGIRHTTFPFGPPLMVGALLVALYPATLLG